MFIHVQMIWPWCQAGGTGWFYKSVMLWYIVCYILWHDVHSEMYVCSMYIRKQT